jgi:hypothetical protein
MKRIHVSKRLRNYKHYKKLFCSTTQGYLCLWESFAEERRTQPLLLAEALHHFA